MGRHVLRLINYLRWLLLPLLAYFCLYPGIALGLYLRRLAEQVCPIEQKVSGVCHAVWFHYAENASLWIGAASIAILVVLVCTWVAPLRRPIVVWAIYAFGVIFTFVLAQLLSAWQEFVSASMAGAVAAILTARYLRRTSDV